MIFFSSLAPLNNTLSIWIKSFLALVQQVLHWNLPNGLLLNVKSSILAMPLPQIESKWVVLRQTLLFPKPKCTKYVRSFLGLCNYCLKCIHDYSTIIGPLTALLKKTINVRRHSDTLLTLRWGTFKQIQWCDDSQSVFDLLKTALTSPSVLSYPDNSIPLS